MKQHYDQRNQQKRRHNNRPPNRGRGQNLTNRALDSNGPDIKIRGTAEHICKKYQSLGRDSQLSGNRVRAENYLQHADHYYRVMLATQAQQRQHQQRQQEAAPPHPGEDRGEDRGNDRGQDNRQDRGQDNRQDKPITSEQVEGAAPAHEDAAPAPEGAAPQGAEAVKDEA